MRNSRLLLLVQRVRLERWTAIAVGAAFLVALAVVIVTTQFQSFSMRGRASSWEPGEVADTDYVVERNFQYVDEKATQGKREVQERTVPPVFALNTLTSSAALDVYDRFSQSLLRQVRQGTSAEKMLLRLQTNFPDAISRADLALLLGSPDLPKALDSARSLLEVVLSGGIIDLVAHRDEAQSARAIEVRRILDGRVESDIVPLTQVTTLDNVAARADGLAADRGYDDALRRVAVALVRDFAASNAAYDAENTQLHRNRAAAAVDPVTEKLARGQVLVRRGDVVSDAAALRISALSAYTKTVDINGVVGSALFLLLSFAIALYLFSMKGVAGNLRHGYALLILGMALGHLALSAIVVRVVPLPDWVPASVVMPTSAMAMLVAILVSTPVGVFFSFVVSLGLLLITGMGIQGFLFAFLSGIAATAVVLDAEKRIDLVRAGLLLSLADALLLLVLGLLANYNTRMMLSLLGWGIANGFLCGILTLGFLPILELLLNAPTRFKLMELSDLNSPIFKRMLSQAPGTYTHSISVANLAETACEAIGANALLARVSAYYHDIGKVDQADYFVENQKAYNRHDLLRPSLSVAVIKSHVRIGIEKARELNLPQAIVDIIAQHHGRGLITFFYHRAMKEGKNPRISRDDYSYPGVRPKTKEAAVLMLADTVEAASRTLKHPTETRLETFVQDMIMEKFNSGELGDSNLTFRDLELIRKSFVHILSGYFHTRIEYPRVALHPATAAASARGRKPRSGKA
jgi:cyclic-di-AMP phosphodiesterase PgpH